jgi:hypothetical protein
MDAESLIFPLLETRIFRTTYAPPALATRRALERLLNLDVALYAFAEAHFNRMMDGCRVADKPAA